MAPQAQEKKQRRRRKKARTEDFSSSSESDSDSSLDQRKPNEDDDEEQQPNNYQDTTTDQIHIDDQMDIDQEPTKAVAASSGSSRIQFPEQLDMTKQTTDQDFTKFYMQLMTSQFGDDLDKLRTSQDFQNKSLALLIDALKQGANIFDSDQKTLIMAGSSALKD